ncbi:MAG: flagellar hook-associated protein FlgL [Planctomycetales bacterium]|nr:flagellar hook-associated protein FlgL [Planctomycetales bacterium]
MNLRVTPNLFVTQAQQAAALHTRNLSELQLQASTGLRLLRPSDDPVAIRTVLASKAQSARIDTQLNNIQTARQRLDQGVTNLLDANNILTSAKQLAFDGRQSIDPVERQTLAAQVDRLLDRLVQTANADESGKYLFGGESNESQPFELTGSGANASVRYQGANIRGTITTTSGASIDSLYTGREIFQSQSRGDTIVLGNTGAAVGTAADSGVGGATLSVAHTSTSFAAGSGVLTGTDSATGDTVLGPAGAHKLTIVDTSGTGAFGTISLDGGPEVNFTAADTNLLVTSGTGDKVYLDTTAITAGFSGDVDITGTGTLSTDGGATTIPIDFSANQQVVNSVTGQVTNIDSSGILRAGEASVEFSGTADAFTVLKQLREDLLNTRGLSNEELGDALNRRVADLDRHRDNILTIVGDQSATLESLEATQQRLEEVQLNLAGVISDRESADMVEVVLNLQNEQNMLQYTFATTSRLFDINLLNFLR